MRPALASRAALSATVLAGISAAGAVGAYVLDPPPPAPTTTARVAAPDLRLLADAHPSSPMRSFYFSRAAYSGGGGWGWGKSWSTDYPKADRQFLVVLRRLTNLDASSLEHPVRLDDPALRRYPFLYAVEVGFMELSEAEVKGLRDYLLAGGFLMVDDFWGSYEWRRFEAQMRRVFPEYPIVELPLDHPVFHTFYDIAEIVQVPNVGQGVAGGPTSEQDGYVPVVRGIMDEEGRLMVAINWNTDLGDAWEWAENPQYPLKYSTYAYQMGVNFIVYAMSH